jgi:DNA-directed RNA polymerase specialized sigma24 family protein
MNKNNQEKKAATRVREFSDSDKKEIINLSDKKKVLLEYYLKGYTLEEIAQEMGYASRGSVHVILKEIKLKLKGSGFGCL